MVYFHTNFRTLFKHHLFSEVYPVYLCLHYIELQPTPTSQIPQLCVWNSYPALLLAWRTLTAYTDFIVWMMFCLPPTPLPLLDYKCHKDKEHYPFTEASQHLQPSRAHRM